MISTVVIISLVVIFLHECTREGMILQVVQRWCWGMPEFVKKPLFDCPVCMCIWWGWPIILLYDFHPVNITQVFVLLFASGGLTAIVTKQWK